MAIQNMLYLRERVVNEHIRIVIPTVGDILENEDKYYSMITALTAVPYDVMVQLDDMGIDFTEISDYELFIMTFQSFAGQDTSLIFGDLDVAGFRMAISSDSGLTVLHNPKTGAVIDLAIYQKICDILRSLHNLKRNNSKPGNEAAKKYLLTKERRRAKRKTNKAKASQLEGLIISMVNTEQFHYGYTEVRDLTIYQFNESVTQIVKKVDYENKMHGVYSGALSASKLSHEEMNWLVNR